MFKDMQDQIRMLLDACKAEDTVITPEMYPPGWSEHEVGTCRMGANPRTSVTNALGQTHDIKNLFIADGGLFTQSSEKSPTVTIMALALREADYLTEQYRRGEL